jgi:hypothetical protein
VIGLLAQALTGAAPCDLSQSQVRAWPAVDHPALTESSGLAPAARSPGLWFTVNDSGGLPELFAFDAAGHLRGRSPVPDVENIDWEDLGNGPCPRSAGPCLFVADIGDNLGKRPQVYVHAVPEPLPGEPARVEATWTLRYPDGLGHDAEALLIHPSRPERLIVSKNRDGHSTVYRLPDTPGLGTLQIVGALDLSARDGWQRRITGGAVRADGGAVALRSYGPIYLYAGGTEAFWKEPPVVVFAGTLDQEEAVAFLPDGGLLTSSEGRPMPLLEVGCPR